MDGSSAEKNDAEKVAGSTCRYHKPKSEGSRHNQSTVLYPVPNNLLISPQLSTNHKMVAAATTQCPMQYDCHVLHICTSTLHLDN